MCGGHVEQGVTVDVHTEDKDHGFARGAVWVATHPMLDKVNTCLDHLEERTEHLSCSLPQCLNLTGRHNLSYITCSWRLKGIGSPY